MPIFDSETFAALYRKIVTEDTDEFEDRHRFDDEREPHPSSRAGEETELFDEVLLSNGETIPLLITYVSRWREAHYENFHGRRVLIEPAGFDVDLVKAVIPDVPVDQLPPGAKPGTQIDFGQFALDEPDNVIERIKEKLRSFHESIDPEQLKMGIQIEHEHTSDDAIAKKIALDHLAEDPQYYTKLKKAGL